MRERQHDFNLFLVAPRVFVNEDCFNSAFIESLCVGIVVIGLIGGFFVMVGVIVGVELCSMTDFGGEVEAGTVEMGLGTISNGDDFIFFLLALLIEFVLFGVEGTDLAGLLVIAPVVTSYVFT